MHPDLLHRYHRHQHLSPKSGEFEYLRSSICQHRASDEINRYTHTQSALLEVMEEQQVTVDGVSVVFPAPFLSLPPRTPSSTKALPEAQMDRFILCLSLAILPR